MFKFNRNSTFKMKLFWQAAMGLGLLLALESFCSLTALADDPANRAAQPKEICLAGKLSCSLKRSAVMPFKGVFTKLIATAGQRVKQGDVLARYRLSPDVILQIRRRLSPPQIADLEIGLNDVEKGLSSLESRYNEARSLMAQNMASEQSLAQVEGERRLLKERQAALQQRIAQERQFAKDDALALKEQLGAAFAPNHVPEVVSLLAPVSGQVISINSEVREGAEVGAGLSAFTDRDYGPDDHENSGIRDRFDRIQDWRSSRDHRGIPAQLQVRSEDKPDGSDTGQPWLGRSLLLRSGIFGHQSGPDSERRPQGRCLRSETEIEC